MTGTRPSFRETDQTLGDTVLAVTSASGSSTGFTDMDWTKLFTMPCSLHNVDFAQYATGISIALGLLLITITLAAQEDVPAVSVFVDLCATSATQLSGLLTKILT